ncbi:MAG: hypothetical protein ACRD3W_21105, partial [Terriglobales bacterium]
INPQPGAAVFGAYDTGERIQSLPSIAKYSWEKAFYGVENPGSLADPRFDQKVCPAPAQTIDLSTEPGKQTGSYNIRLVIPWQKPALAQERPVVVEAPFAELIKTARPNFSAPSETASQHAIVSDLPQYKSTDLWAVRVHNAVRAGRQTHKSRINLIADCARNGKQSTYESPWLPGNPNVFDNDGSFDYCAIFEPSQLPGKITDLRIDYASDVGRKKHALAAGDAGIAVDIWRLPARPLSRGYQVL